MKQISFISLKTPLYVVVVILFCLNVQAQMTVSELENLEDMKNVHIVDDYFLQPPEADWLISAAQHPAEMMIRINREDHETHLLLTNGLIAREFLLTKNLACVQMKNLYNDAQFIRAIKPEARVMIDSVWYEIGGLKDQPENSYLMEDWYSNLKSDSSAFFLNSLETSDPIMRYPWEQKFNASPTDWPPKGLHVIFHYKAPHNINTNLHSVNLAVHYEMYEGLPVIAKWLTIENNSGKKITVNQTECEILAIAQDQINRIHVESDYSFGLVNARPEGSALLHYSEGKTPLYKAGGSTTIWDVDPDYTTWATHNPAEDGFLNYPHHCLLKSRVPMGPAVVLEPGGSFKSITTIEIIHDSDDKERQSLAQRKMYRKLAPQTTESLLSAAITSHDEEQLNQFIDQMNELGFERLGIHPWPGVSHDNLDPEYIAHWKKTADYARSKNIIMGAYELQVASRGRNKLYDCIDPMTDQPGSAFGQSVCIASQWKDIYFPKMWQFFNKTGFMSFDMDGPYHGDPCASTTHSHHRRLEDSQWQQWKTQVDILHELQRKKMYVPIPDWYFLNGQSATGMGYREASANLTPQQQLLLGRQYIYDGTWHKTPTMGWMSLQLVGFYTNDPRVGLEPLSENLDRYERGLVQHLGSGCQFSVRGNRLYDTPETKEMVMKWVDWFKKYRTILTSDIIHLGRPTGRDLDCILHVNAENNIRGIAVIFNPTNHPIKKMFRIPLYYTGLTENALIREKEGESRTFMLNREYEVEILVEIGSNGFSWFVIEGP